VIDTTLHHLEPLHSYYYTIDGADFIFNNTRLVIDETSVRECITFTIINDAVSEGGETLQAYLSLVYAVDNGTISNDSIVMLTVDQANVTLFDSIGKLGY
jgi:hypothetical protein